MGPVQCISAFDSGRIEGRLPPLRRLAGDDSDSTQRAAFAEGICVPPRLNASIHVFSSAEAKECLRSRRMIISGDSFMKQQFIGLADILLSKKLNGDKEPSTRSTRARSWHR